MDAKKISSKEIVKVLQFLLEAWTNACNTKNVCKKKSK